MKILMLGWEYPPKISGGLGVASQGIAEALAKQANVTFLLPKKNKQVSKNVNLIDLEAFGENADVWYEQTKKKTTRIETTIGQILVPYLPPQLFTKKEKKEVTTIELTIKEEAALLSKISLTGDYENNLLDQLTKYEFLAANFAATKTYDIIHAHDWPTFKAAISIKKTLNIPLAVHMHSTEYERNGIHAQKITIDFEKEGLEAADVIFTVSQGTKKIIETRFGINPSKIKVIPNAVNLKPTTGPSRIPKKIGFIGRFTDQKSPSTFLDLVRALKSKGQSFEYIMMGDGYLLESLKEKASSQNLNIEFTGFLSRQTVLKKLNTLDLLVVPSNAEPFGLVTLEAIMKGIPVAAALGSGVAEFVPSLPQIDKWNHFAYAQLIEKLMTDLPFREKTIHDCLKEASNLSWAKSAENILSNYPES
jgi:glycogen(starch) synthase